MYVTKEIRIEQFEWFQTQKVGPFVPGELNQYVRRHYITKNQCVIPVPHSDEFSQFIGLIK